MIKKLLLAILLLISNLFLFGQKIKDNQFDVLALKYTKASFDELKEFFSLPNDAYYPNDIEKNIKWCEKAFAARGFETSRLKTEKIPLLLAEKKYPKAKKTVLVYLQVDGQPVDSTKWQQESPWTPTLKEKKPNKNWEKISWDKLDGGLNPEWRIFVRSASDAKGPVMMFLKAMDILNDYNHNPNFNLKVIMDFEEELGSPRLPAAVKEHREKLASDMLVIFDGPRHISNQPTLTYGARGIATVTLEVFGPKVPQHSGHYGNYAPNPALKLSKLLASMKDDNGRVKIPGWYDGITLTDDIKNILKQVPDDENMIRKKIGVATIDKVADNYQEAIQYPSLNILGLESGWVGKETRTIIPSNAIAELDIRLVKESDPEVLISKLKEHIKEQGFYFVTDSPTEAERQTYPNLIKFKYEISYGAFRTDFDTEIGKWLRAGMNKSFGKDPIQIRTAGGSIPISPFVVTLNIPAVSVPTVNPDNNQHSPNENIRLGNYIDGIKTIAAILTEKL